MVTKKIVAKKTPTVTVETKKIESEKEMCCTSSNKGCCIKPRKMLMMVLMIINTVLLVFVLMNQSRIEATKVGGNENYKLLKTLFMSEGYKTQQKVEIEKALKIFQNPQVQQPTQEVQQPVQNTQTQQPAQQ